MTGSDFTDLQITLRTCESVTLDPKEQDLGTFITITYVLQCTCMRSHSVTGMILPLYPGGGGGVLNKVLYGEAPPRGPTPYPFIYHFGRKNTPFIYLLLKKGTPFTYLF